MKFRAHKPNYMTGFEEPDHHFETKDGLLEAPQVKRFAASEKFHRFSCDGKRYLMVELEEGFKWFVCGYVEGIDLREWFPKWEPKYTQFELDQRAAEEENFRRDYEKRKAEYKPPPKPQANSLEDLIALQMKD